MNLLDFFNLYYRPRRLLGKSPETSRLYRMSVQSFGRFLGRDPIVDDLTDDHIAGHMQWVIDNGRSAATANKDRAQLLTLWRFAHRLRMTKEWPTVGQIAEPSRIPIAWTAEELAVLFDAAAKQDGDLCGVPQSLWWTALINLCLDTGERIGAVSQASRDSLRGDWILAVGESRKGRTRDKLYQLRPSTVESLRAVIASHRCDHAACASRLFPWPLHRLSLWRKFGELLDAAGLPSGRRDKFHKLRRSTASIIWAMGGNPQEVLDHADQRTTRAYLDPRFDPNRQASELLAEYLRNPRRRDPPDQRATG